jgi:hypothetical protein
MLLILFVFPCSYLRQWAICCDDIYALYVILSFLFEAMAIFVSISIVYLSTFPLPMMFLFYVVHHVRVLIFSLSASPVTCICILLLWIRQETIHHQCKFMSLMKINFWWEK